MKEESYLAAIQELDDELDDSFIEHRFGKSTGPHKYVYKEPIKNGGYRYYYPEDLKAKELNEKADKMQDRYNKNIQSINEDLAKDNKVADTIASVTSDVTKGALSYPINQWAKNKKEENAAEYEHNYAAQALKKAQADGMRRTAKELTAQSDVKQNKEDIQKDLLTTTAKVAVDLYKEIKGAEIGTSRVAKESASKAQSEGEAQQKWKDEQKRTAMAKDAVNSLPSNIDSELASKVKDKVIEVVNKYNNVKVTPNVSPDGKVTSVIVMAKDVDDKPVRELVYPDNKLVNMAKHSFDLSTKEGYYAAIQAYKDGLEHHGILGMKWGIRRYQNPDGSLTELGKKHLEDGKTQKVIDKFNQQKSIALAKGDADFARKNIDYLSNDELTKFKERISARTSIEDLKQASRKITADKLDSWSRMVQSGANMLSNGVNAYNNAAKIINAVTKKQTVPILKDNDNNNNNQKGKEPSIMEIYRNSRLESYEETKYREDGTKVTTKKFYNTKDDKQKGK